MLVHEPHHAFVRPHLGIQPSTAASHWGGAEVEEYRLSLGLRVLQDLINVMAKLDWHGMLAAGNVLNIAGPSPKTGHDPQDSNTKRFLLYTSRNTVCGTSGETTGAVDAAPHCVTEPFGPRAVAAGVDAELDVWMGMPHGFVTGIREFDAARQALSAIGAFLTERLL